jgi:HTH-type transcriptional regulator/antitoxin HipB
MRVARPEDIGALLRGYRAEHGLSQTQLAQRLQTSQRWVSEIENGKPTAHLGLVIRALNELGFQLDISASPKSKGKAKPRFSIDDIVDG